MIPGDRLTAEEVFHAYAPRVYSLALLVLGKTPDAEDFTLEVLLQVDCKLNSFRGTLPPSGCTA